MRSMYVHMDLFYNLELLKVSTFSGTDFFFLTDLFFFFY